MANSLFGFGFGPKAFKFLDGMPPGKLRRQITNKAKSLIKNPYPPGCKKLYDAQDGADPVYRIRSGDYRILYSVNDLEVIVLDIGNRKDIYT